MYYTLILVDDEDIIRRGLSTMVDWHALGFEVTATFDSARSALDYLAGAPADVVLTDIKMDVMSGLELARDVSQQWPQTKVVLISGHREFEFARQALAYNVFSYLLKPTSLTEIRETFDALKRQLDEDREQQQLAAEQFYADILAGALKSKETLLRRASAFDLEFDPQDSPCCIISFTFPAYEQAVGRSWEYGKEGYFAAIRNGINSDDKRLFLSPLCTDQHGIRAVAAATAPMDAASFQELLKAHVRSVCESVSGVLGIALHVELSPLYDSLIALAARAMHPPRPLPGTPAVDVQQSQEHARSLEEHKRSLVTYINAGNLEAVSDLYAGMVEGLDQIPMNALRDFIISLFALIHNKISESGVDLHSAFPSGLPYGALMEAASSQDVLSWGQRALEQIVEEAVRQQGSAERATIQRARQYIREHFDQDISLVDVSDRIYLSPMYFSRLFKKETGQNFIDYLIQVRMERAMELLRDDIYKVYEIPGLIGYRSMRHFLKLFRLYTGFTPTEYRQRNQRATGE